MHTQVLEILALEDEADGHQAEEVDEGPLPGWDFRHLSAELETAILRQSMRGNSETSRKKPPKYAWENTFAVF